jgi:UrcA family protein
MYRITTMIMIFSLALAIQAADADAATDARATTVRFADLDLARTAGAAALYHRLWNAAQSVCAPVNGRDLANQALFKGCLRGAMEAAVAKVDHPTLTAYYRGLNDPRNASMQVVQK